MHNHIRLYPADLAASPFVLYDFDSKGKLKLRPRYSQFQCTKCGKVNESLAISSGIDDDVKIRTNRDVIPSSDDLYIISERFKQFVESIHSTCFSCIPLPGSVNFFVAFTSETIVPQRDCQSFRFIGDSPCSSCNRNLEVLWGKEPVIIDQKTTLATIFLETRRSANPVWVLRDDYANAIKQADPPFRGIVWKPLPK